MEGKEREILRRKRDPIEEGGRKGGRKTEEDPVVEEGRDGGREGREKCMGKSLFKSPSPLTFLSIPILLSPLFPFLH